MCDHNILVIGSEGKLGPIWVRDLATRNSNNLIFATCLETIQGSFAGFINVRNIVLDVTNYSEDTLRKIILENSICRIVYNSGIDTPPESKKVPNFYSTGDEEIKKTLEVNLVGAMKVFKSIGKILEANNHGSVVLLGSLYASLAPDQKIYSHLRGETEFNKPMAYCVSKAGLVSLGRYLATLWGKSNIRVNTLSPGGVLGNQDEEFLIKFKEKTPLNRLADAESDIAPVINFLLSDDSKYITGQEIIADGGYSIW
jgi:NAD(P)-dependent dehydrogenase (short-subunit alcohol dehydrogenase family)